MLWDKIPCVEAYCPAEPHQSNCDTLKCACTPHLEQMCHSLGSTISMHQTALEGKVPRELVRRMCEPYFEQMLTSMQACLQDKLRHGRPQSASWSQQPSLAASPGCEEDSTEADEEVAFGTLLSSTSSDMDILDALEKKSVTSEATCDDKSPMVCRHWKSKGWCRLGGDCKFLHPEHKRGITAPLETEVVSSSQARRRKRGGKNRSTSAKLAQLCSDEQSVASAK